MLFKIRNFCRGLGGKVRCSISVILALKRLRQENNEFQASMDYIARPCLKINK
jgi:hypothetical protein